MRDHHAMCGTNVSTTSEPKATSPGQVAVVVVILLLIVLAAAFGQPVPASVIEFAVGVGMAVFGPRAVAVRPW